MFLFLRNIEAWKFENKCLIDSSTKPPRSSQPIWAYNHKLPLWISLILNLTFHNTIQFRNHCNILTFYLVSNTCNMWLDMTSRLKEYSLHWLTSRSVNLHVMTAFPKVSRCVWKGAGFSAVTYSFKRYIRSKTWVACSYRKIIHARVMIWPDAKRGWV